METSVREAFYAAEGEKLLVKHVADADEIAEAYIFLMKLVRFDHSILSNLLTLFPISYRCKYVTGQRIEVDGGFVLV